MCNACGGNGKSAEESNDPCASEEMKKNPIAIACATCLPQKKSPEICNCGEAERKNNSNKKTIITEICISCGGEIRKVPIQEICIESRTKGVEEKTQQTNTSDNKDAETKESKSDTKESCPESKPEEKKCPADKTNYPETLPCDLKRCKSRELRGGVYYITCDCVKRNGLQDDCRRTCCQGSAECRIQPDAKCCPSQFPRKYLQMPMGTRKPEKPNKF